MIVKGSGKEFWRDISHVRVITKKLIITFMHAFKLFQNIFILSKRRDWPRHGFLWSSKTIQGSVAFVSEPFRATGMCKRGKFTILGWRSCTRPKTPACWVAKSAELFRANQGNKIIILFCPKSHMKHWIKGRLLSRFLRSLWAQYLLTY